MGRGTIAISHSVLPALGLSFTPTPAELTATLKLPDDYEVEGSSFDYARGCLIVGVLHPDLPTVIEGTRPPEVTPTYERLEDGTVRVLSISVYTPQDYYPWHPQPLPTTKHEPRPVIAAFARLMEGKLAANDHKDEWCHASQATLLALLMAEVRELCEALEDGALPADIGSECSDVALCAMFIADRHGCLGDFADRGRVRMPRNSATVRVASVDATTDAREVW